MTKILLVDIETAPNIAYVWGAWKNDIGHNQWKEKSYILSFAAKWLGNDKIFYEENRKNKDKKLVQSMFALLDEADIVIAHNGKGFDLPIILARGLVHGLQPPSPYLVVDTLLVARNHFRFVSNSLANLTQELDLPVKGGHKKFPGFELWLEVLRNNDEAWAEMKEYNIQDVISLEALYLKMRPYMRNHPNVSRLEGEEVACPKCGSTNIQWRGYVYTNSGLCYRRFQCKDCGGWGRARFSEKDKNQQGRNA